MKQSNWLIIIIVVIAFAVIIDFFDSSAPHEEPKKKRNTEPRYASVLSELRLNEYESIRVLSIPDPMLESSPMFDSRCLLYVNKELGQSQIKCLPKTGGSSSE